MPRDRSRVALLAAPALAFFVAFWLLPISRLVSVGASGPEGALAYFDVVTHPVYLRSFIATTALSLSVTAVTLVFGVVAGVFLERTPFPGRRLLVALVTFPLAFPGVVVGFFVIMMTGRQGLLAHLGSALGQHDWVLAYGIGGLFLGYVYFSLPRVIVTIMAAAAKLDLSLEEAARSLGASPWRVTVDVVLPALAPAMIASGALCFATAMGAFGTAFTLASHIDVLPMTIYNEFTNYANFATAASLALVLGVLTAVTLALARSLAGAGVAAAA